jgi:hypothetical protein
MAAIVNRPVSRKIKTNLDSRPVYTLHSNPNSVFAWTTSHPNMKTATVVFRRYMDAIHMAHMIERHVRQTKEWPSTTMFDFNLYSGPVVSNELELIDIQAWEFENLKVYCVESYLDMITLTTLNETEQGFKITGELISLDVPCELYVEQLNTKFYTF